MSSLSELVARQTDLLEADVGHLHRLLEAWELIADLSFADLRLWCRLSGDGFVCVAQMRPHTAQTLHPEDAFGSTIRPEELPVIDRAFAEGSSWQQDEPVLIDDLQVRMEAIPVRRDGNVIAVMTKEGTPLVHRRPGRLEEVYLECAHHLSRMVESGYFPIEGQSLDPELSPRVGDGLVKMDRDGRVSYASPNAMSAYRRLGITSSVIGEHLSTVGIDGSVAARALSHGVPAEGEMASGDTIVLQWVIPLLVPPDRRVEGALMLVRDVTELRHREQMLQRKDAVIKEIHHRVKNNLQTVASLLRIQARRLSVPEARHELEEAVRRISSIAVVHETLTRESTESVEFVKVARDLVDMVVGGLVHPGRRIETSVVGEPGRLSADMATPLAVALVELVQNAVDHAFDESGGRIEIHMERRDGRLRLEVRDNGRGIPEGGLREGLGLQIVRGLVAEELAGSIDISSDRGTRVLLELPLSRPSGERP